MCVSYVGEYHKRERAGVVGGEALKGWRGVLCRLECRPGLLVTHPLFLGLLVVLQAANTAIDQIEFLLDGEPHASHNASRRWYMFVPTRPST